jgi:nucleoside 2-deoxyribosyltransferase
MRRTPVNVYFSCSLTGGRENERIYGRIVDHLLDRGHEVPTAHLARPEVMDLERVVMPADVYHRDIGWIEACQAMIAEVSTPSHGVGYEIAFALGLGKPVLCCYREGKPVSKMLTGNNSKGLEVRAYHDPGHAIELIDAFLMRLADR